MEQCAPQSREILRDSRPWRAPSSRGPPFGDQPWFGTFLPSRRPDQGREAQNQLTQLHAAATGRAMSSGSWSTMRSSPFLHSGREPTQTPFTRRGGRGPALRDYGPSGRLRQSRRDHSLGSDIRRAYTRSERFARSQTWRPAQMLPTSILAAGERRSRSSLPFPRAR